MKRRIRLSESDLHKMIKESVRKALNESHFDDEAFEKWEEETHIPPRIMKMVTHVCNQIGYRLDEDDEEVITFYNRGGYPYAYAKGFTISHCTSSYADGPSEDYSGEILQWLKGLGFKQGRSYGDNGMDSATNWRDTYWHVDVYYEPTLVYDEEFQKYDDDDYEW